jgi:hypothetical protein
MLSPSNFGSYDKLLNEKRGMMMNPFGCGKKDATIVAMPTREDDFTFGFDPPANPAFTVEVPLSRTMGWFRSIELGTPSPATAATLSPDFIMLMERRAPIGMDFQPNYNQKVQSSVSYPKETFKKGMHGMDNFIKWPKKQSTSRRVYPWKTSLTTKSKTLILKLMSIEFSSTQVTLVSQNLLTS